MYIHILYVYTVKELRVACERVKVHMLADKVYDSYCTLYLATLSTPVVLSHAS